ncbi:MAG: HD domain-containing protein [Phycisphaerales bacterium]|nr:HD domain-containing protein [Phycisphaerales bacterium]
MTERNAIRVSVNANDEVLRRQGIVRRIVNETGECSRRPTRGDWLEELLLSSSLVQNEFNLVLESLRNGDVVQPREVVPGIWILAASTSCNRRNNRDSIAVLATRELATGEHLNLLCQAGRLDRTVVTSMLSGLDLAAGTEVPRISELLRLIASTEGEVARRTVMLEEIGRQLGETYEEVHLFHTLIGETSVATNPTRFLDMVVDELLRILPFSWIGIRIDMNDMNLPDDFSGFMVGGSHDDSNEDLMHLGDRLLATVEGREPIVVDSRSDPRFDAITDCGASVIVCPVAGDNGTIGVLYAGKKQGVDETASSIEAKLVGAAAEHVSVFLRNASMYENLDAMFLGTVQGMVSAIDAKDPYTCGHSQRVSWLAGRLAAAYGWDEAGVRRVELAGLVHDVGKIGVPESVLCKAGRLTDPEFDQIKQHPGIGARILRDIPQMKDILPAVLHHHERWDGGGYPMGLAGDEIPMIARFVAIADAFDAMSSDRTYRSARPRDYVLQEITRCAGTQFDPRLVEPFMSITFDEFDQMVHGHRDLHGGSQEAA